MAITAVGTSTTQTAAPGTSLSWAHDSDTGTARILIIAVAFRSTTDIITGVTYNSIALTQLSGSPKFNNAGDNVAAAVWYLVNPATGSNTVVVSFSSSNNCAAAAQTYAGVHQTVSFGTTITGGDGGTPVTNGSVTVTSATDELSISGFSVGGETVTMTSGDILESTAGTSGGGGIDRAVGLSRQAGAASVVMDWSWVATTGWAGIGVSLKPVAAGSNELRRIVVTRSS